MKKVLNFLALILLLIPLAHYLLIQQYNRSSFDSINTILFIAYGIVILSLFCRSNPLPDLRNIFERNKYGTLIALFFITAYVLYYIKESFSCSYLVSMDNVFHFIAAMQFALKDLPSLKPFGWLDFQGGMPLLLHYSPGFFYTFGVLYTLTLGVIDANYLWTVYLALITLFIGFSTYFLMRTLGFPRLVSFFAGLFLTTWRLDPFKDVSPYLLYDTWGVGPQVFSYIPLTFFLAFFFLSMKTFSRRHIILAGMFYCYSFISHAYFTFIITAFIALYSIVLLVLKRDIVKRFTVLLSLFLIFCSLTLFFSLPYLKNTDYLINDWHTFRKEPVRKALNDFLWNRWSMRIDGHYMYLWIFGFLGIASVVKKRNRGGKIFLILYAVTPLLFGLVDLSLPVTQPVAYTHQYGRLMALFKAAWICLAVVGVYELSESLKKISRDSYMIALFLFLAITLDQVHYNNSFQDKFQCFSSEVSSNFMKPRGNVDELQAIGEIIRGRPYGRILLYSNAPHLGLLEEYFTGYGVYKDWVSDKAHMRLRYYAYYVYRKFDRRDLNNIYDILSVDNIRYLIVDSRRGIPTELKPAIGDTDRFDVLYDNDYTLIEAKNLSHVEVPGKVFALVDDSVFWRDLSRWNGFMDAGVIDDGTRVVLMKSSELDSSDLDKFRYYIVGDIDCSRTEWFFYEKESDVVGLLSTSNASVYVLDHPVRCNLDVSEVLNARVIRFNELRDFFKSMPASYNGSISYFVHNDSRREFSISSGIDPVPVVVKDNYYPNWMFSQNRREIKKYFVFPDNMLAFVKPYRNVLVEYRTPYIEILGFIFSFISFTVLVYLLVRERGSQKD